MFASLPGRTFHSCLIGKDCTEVKSNQKTPLHAGSVFLEIGLPIFSFVSSQDAVVKEGYHNTQQTQPSVIKCFMIPSSLKVKISAATFTSFNAAHSRLSLQSSPAFLPEFYHFFLLLQNAVTRLLNMQTKAGWYSLNESACLTLNLPS